MINLKIAMEHDHEFRGDFVRGDGQIIAFPPDEVFDLQFAPGVGFVFPESPLVSAMEASRPYSRRHRIAALESVTEDQGFWALLLVAIGLALVAVSKMIKLLSGGSKGFASGGGGGSGGSVGMIPSVQFKLDVIRLSSDNVEIAFDKLLGTRAPHEVKDMIQKEKLFDHFRERVFSNFTELDKQIANPSSQLANARSDSAISSTDRTLDELMRDSALTGLTDGWLKAFDAIEANGWGSAGMDWKYPLEKAEHILSIIAGMDQAPMQKFMDLRGDLADKSVTMSDSDARRWLHELFGNFSGRQAENMTRHLASLTEAVQKSEKFIEAAEKNQKNLEAGFEKHKVAIQDLSNSKASTKKNLIGISDADAEKWQNDTRIQYNEAQQRTKEAFKQTLEMMRFELRYIGIVVSYMNRHLDLYKKAKSALSELNTSLKAAFKAADQQVPAEVDEAATLLKDTKPSRIPRMSRP